MPTMIEAKLSSNQTLIEAFRYFVDETAFPCIGAKAALHRNGIEFLVGYDIRSDTTDQSLYAAISALTHYDKIAPHPFQSLVMLFELCSTQSEIDYEKHLWHRLNTLTVIDVQNGHSPDPQFSADPKNTNFALSIAGEAFFVVGLHPNASRPARRFQCPAIVFNSHRQFAHLRTTGQYEPMRNKIIHRDTIFSGTPNPMLARHGERSEARQYSGRVVGDDWKCPLIARKV